MNGILDGSDELIAAWAFATFKFYPMPVDKALGILSSDGKVVGAALFQNFNGSNVELSYCGPKTLTLGIVRALAQVIVTHFDAARLTVVTSKRNKAFMRGLLKIGFKLEGHQRCFYGREDSNRNIGVRFVMFRDRINQLAMPMKGKDASAV